MLKVCESGKEKKGVGHSGQSQLIDGGGGKYGYTQGDIQVARLRS